MRKKSKAIKAGNPKDCIPESLLQTVAEALRVSLPDFRTTEREKWKRKEKEGFIKKALNAGFSKQMAEFLYKSFALHDHEHWDGRVG
jgi:hypothetical protein